MNSVIISSPQHTSRVLVGVAAGIALCVGPIFLSEIAPSKIRGAVGLYLNHSLLSTFGEKQGSKL